MDRSPSRTAGAERFDAKTMVLMESVTITSGKKSRTVPEGTRRARP
jgi:hypothetical protein